MATVDLGTKLARGADGTKAHTAEAERRKSAAALNLIPLDYRNCWF